LARKILLADDSVTAQNMGRKILADAGYEVITVNNGSAALKKIAEQKPDLIVLDVYMPGYSGLEVCQRLKDAQETSRVPVLLTVGKLEPFKPEEARRARADGFIVKPFEASELLSALSKLEDKIVPRAETSKPGRFARANAAMDEGRYDKTVAIEEDSSWKNRIAFPKKKTEPAPEEADESTIYNAMNKDLRTVIERKAAEQPYPAKAEEVLVDLGALAPEGLPKDVTPEEIAALAAAAAQVKGKIAEANVADEIAGEVAGKATGEVTEKVTEKEEKIAASRMVEAPVAARTEPPAQAPEPIQAAPATRQEVAAAPTFAAQKSEEKIEATAEKTVEAKIEAAEKAGEARPEEASIVSPSIVAPSHGDLMAAIAALEPEPVASPGTSSGTSSGQPASGNASGGASWLQGAPDPADEPVTMAVAAGVAEPDAAASRWTAVAMTLAPEEAVISLEHEMQKAYAAFAAADSGPAVVVATIPATPSGTPQRETSQAQASQSEATQSQPSQSQPVPAPFAAPAAAAVPEPTVAVPATPIQQVEQTLSAVANVATDAISAAVQELEAVAAAYAEQMKPAAAAPQPAPVKDFVIAGPLAPQAPQTSAVSVEASFGAKTEESPVAAREIPQVESPRPEVPQPPAEEPNQRKEQLSQQEIEEPELAEAKIEAKIETKSEEPKSAEAKREETKSAEVKIEEVKIQEAKIEEVKNEVAAPVFAAVAPAAEPTFPAAATPPEKAPTPVNEVPAEASSASPVSSPATSSEAGSGKFSSSSIFSSDILSSNIVSSHMAAVAFDEPAAGGLGDMAKKESEIAANTAAAWANWRRIRETDPKAAGAEPSEKEAPVESAPQDAAMAVAAGAEKAPEEARAAHDAEPDEIASIVDSVLADLRPKIVEEISRKMGKKK
jgi:two-component system chemotaxis response regulator CheY